MCTSDNNGKNMKHKAEIETSELLNIPKFYPFPLPNEPIANYLDRRKNKFFIQYGFVVQDAF